ncbi:MULTISPECIES: ACR3 family arsenite efflux transporter [unclassified Cyanobium]|uniref:ACR3 family arsenite efflux transporter n=1 Tax=unclassified Cyanobium TaxID=2627006 RepID=UPI0020CFA501|nr:MULTISPECIES: ACR3 family arsenite efflux transporter [unclassified Cyanobium]MCP9860241.1 ACR3 family arsenite efflux transporter [Cyanobium sp. Cruz-8H5]MCP9867515.1 ACR3 family arsenite efflux transporter [Cyanobium sp. Cruz-8D1]
MGIFERFLSLWVALAIVAGVALGALMPQLSEAVAAFEFARINLLIALLVWGMIFPMMLAVDFGSIAGLRRQPKGLVVTVVVNWLIKPLTMTAIAWLFIRGLFGAWIPAAVGDQYIAGMILLGVAPCTAMVFVWSRLSNGDPNYTLAQVAINDLIMVFAFAPIAALLLGVSNVLVPWDTLVTAVGLFVVVPLAAGWLTRVLLRSPTRIERLEQRLKPVAIVSLIVTVLLLFMVQAQAILSNPLAIVLIAIPLTLQTYLIFWITALWMRFWHQPHAIAAPGAMIGASNFFELAVAVAISLFGIDSGAALATVVGVLVEVPVMLSLVAIANRNRRLFPAAVS